MKRLFVDMDGTLCEFKHVSSPEELLEKGYFRSLKPFEGMLAAIRILESREDIEVNILSAVLSDSKYALEEKQQWLDENLPELDRRHRIFTVCGQDKKEFIPGGIDENDYLLDDYTLNLMQWCPPGCGIKAINYINDTHGTWKGDRVTIDWKPEAIACRICHEMGLYEQEQRIAQELGYTWLYNDKLNIYTVANDICDCITYTPDKALAELVENDLKAEGKDTIKRLKESNVTPDMNCAEWYRHKVAVGMKDRDDSPERSL